MVEVMLLLLAVWAAYEFGRYRGIRWLRKQIAADRRKLAGDKGTKRLHELLAEGLQHVGLREDIDEETEAAVYAWEAKVRAMLNTSTRHPDT